MTLTSQAAAAGRWTALASGITVGSELLRTVVLARVLEPIDFGLMAIVLVVVGFAQMYADVGISAAIIHRQDATKGQLSSLYWLNVFAGWVVFGLVWCSTPLITKFYGEPRLLLILKAVSTVFLITPISSQFETLLQKELSFDKLAKRDIVGSVSQTAVAIICALGGCGVWALVCGFLAGAVLRTALVVHVSYARFRPSLHFRRSDLKGYLSFGLFQIGERSAYYLSQRSDQILIGSLLGTMPLGYYSFALNLAAQPLWRLNPILNKVAFPVFSRVQEDLARLRRGYLKLVGIVAACNAPLLVGLAAVAPWVVPSAFGSRWHASVPLVQILSFVMLLRSINNPAGSLLYAKGHVGSTFVWHLLALLLSLPVVYITCRIGSVKSVALGVLFLQVAFAVPFYLLLLRRVLGKCDLDYARATVNPVVAASAMGLGVLGVGSLCHALPVLLLLPLQLTLGAFVYLVLLFLLHRETLADIRSLVQRH